MISIDPYAGQIYNLKADLILVSHGHPDQNAADRIQNRSEARRIMSNTDALVNGEQRTFDLGDPKVEAVHTRKQPES